MKMDFSIFKIYLIIILFMSSACQDNINEEKFNKTDSLENQNSKLSIQVDSILNKNKELYILLNYWFDEEFQGEKFFERGIENPEEFVEKALREKNDLIPLKPVLGGTMHFDNIQLLSSEWLIADYSDGHIQGRAIYSYRFNRHNVLTFKKISYINYE